MQFDPPNMQLEFDPDGDPKRPWKALCEHSLSANGVLRVTVPEGFHCDLASVPDFLLALFGGPWGRWQRAGLFHDALYDKYRNSDIISRATCDQVFRQIMRSDGVPWLTRNLFYLAVRLFGGRYWRNP